MVGGACGAVDPVTNLFVEGGVAGAYIGEGGVDDAVGSDECGGGGGVWGGKGHLPERRVDPGARPLGGDGGGEEAGESAASVVGHANAAILARLLRAGAREGRPVVRAAAEVKDEGGGVAGCLVGEGGGALGLGWGHRAHPVVWDRAGAEANELQLEQSGVPNAARVPHPDNVGERLLELGPHELEERASTCVAVAQEGAADFEDSHAPAQALLAGRIAGVVVVGRAGYVGWRGGEVARRRVEVGLWEARVEVAVALAEAALVVV